MASADVLQYGALGLLLAVLVSGFTIAKRIFERMFDQNDSTLKFVQDQIEKGNAETSSQMLVWVDMMRDMISTSVTTAEALGRISESLNHISDQHKEILLGFRAINGKK